ncbi:MAG: 4-hydroxythreonine-4-phosphate dehydrogenase PdxA, partial [Ramlibacter sp.]|nr:4-hydroxythreonine-4-phosphate dehydrogenase PdxA [Ramlibacter sp.]
MNKILAITMGDPAGIGPEIVAKAFRQEPGLTRGCFVAGDVACLRRGAAWASGAGVALPVAVIATPADLAQVP